MRAKAVAIIPARYGSHRFPGKVLASRTGKPLIQHVFEQVSQAKRISRIIIAADDARILEAAEAFGCEAVMTRADHPNGTSRIAEVAATLSEDIVVNVQADEPEVDPAAIDCAVEHLTACTGCSVATLAAPFLADEDPANPNLVKVVRSAAGMALYFSRSLIPYHREDGDAAQPLKHIGLYVYRREFLLEYITLPPTPLEQSEKLEQLRILEHGRSIAVAIYPAHFHGIDTPEQYEAFVRRCGMKGRSDAATQ